MIRQVFVIAIAGLLMVGARSARPRSGQASLVEVHGHKLNVMIGGTTKPGMSTVVFSNALRQAAAHSRILLTAVGSGTAAAATVELPLLPVRLQSGAIVVSSSRSCAPSAASVTSDGTSSPVDERRMT
jgi:hypothetical protein